MFKRHPAGSLPYMPTDVKHDCLIRSPQHYSPWTSSSSHSFQFCHCAGTPRSWCTCSALNVGIQQSCVAVNLVLLHNLGKQIALICIPLLCMDCQVVTMLLVLDITEASKTVFFFLVQNNPNTPLIFVLDRLAYMLLFSTACFWHQFLCSSVLQYFLLFISLLENLLSYLCWVLF